MYLAIKAFLKRLWRPPGVSLREDPGISGLRIPSVAPQLDSLDVVPRIIQEKEPPANKEV